MKVRTPEVTGSGGCGLLHIHSCTEHSQHKYVITSTRDREVIDEHKLYGTNVRLFIVHFATEECPYGGQYNYTSAVSMEYNARFKMRFPKLCFYCIILCPHLVHRPNFT